MSDAGGLDWYNLLPLHTTTVALLCGVVVGYTSPADRRRLASVVNTLWCIIFRGVHQTVADRCQHTALSQFLGLRPTLLHCQKL